MAWNRKGGGTGEVGVALLSALKALLIKCCVFWEAHQIRAERIRPGEDALITGLTSLRPS